MFAKLILETLERRQWPPSRLASEVGITWHQLVELMQGEESPATSRVLSQLTRFMEPVAETVDGTVSGGLAGKTANSVDPPVVVGISGPSCSGKSWLAAAIRDQRRDDIEVLDLDGYYRDLKDVDLLEHGHDNPNSIDYSRAANDLRQLKLGQATLLPVYSFEMHQIVGTRHCQPKSLILVEGLFVFADPSLRDQIDIKIWMEAFPDLRLDRRIRRDTVQRQRTVEEIHERYDRDVIPGFQKFIHPLREHADVIVANNGQDDGEIPLIARLLLAYLKQTPQL